MKNVFKIIGIDFRLLFRQFWAVLIILSIMVIPALYAWINIYANWNPYGNTGNITLACASDDEGYELDGEYQNVGETVLKSLTEKTNIHFVSYDSSDEAIQAVESGEVYGAIILNKDFTRNMYDITHAIRYPENSMTFYENYKTNAIANKITESAAKKVNETVQTQYLQVLFETLFSTFGTAAKDTNLESTGDNVIASLTRIRDAAGALSDGVSSLIILCNNTSSLFRDVNISGNEQKVTDIHDSITSTASDIQNTDWAQNISAVIEQIFHLSDSETAVSSLQERLVENGISGTSPEELIALADDIEAQVESMIALADYLDPYSTEEFDTADWDDSFFAIEDSAAALDAPEASDGSDSADLAAALDAAELAEALDAENAEQNALTASELRAYAESWTEQASELREIAEAITTGILTFDLYDALEQVFSDFLEQLQQFNSFVENDVIPCIVSRMELYIHLLQNSWPLIQNLAKTLDSITPLAQSGADTLSSAAQALLFLQKAADKIVTSLDDVIDSLNGLSDNETVNTLLTTLGGDPEAFAEFFSSPVTMNTTNLFPSENYGTAMAPFYSTLAIWIGCIILAAVVKVEASGHDLPNVTDAQLFWSRFLIYLLFSEIQTFVILAGDLWMLGIHCEHVGLLFLCGAITSFVFVCLIYSIVLSFGDIGKAVVIIILVLQIAGSGGTYPIEILEDTFEYIFKLFPFPYAINAMREAIFGLYGSDIVKYLAELLLFAAIGLSIGLFVRKPFIGINKFVEEEMEGTGVM